MRAQRARTRYVGPLYLPVDVAARLERLGEAEERDIVQHVRWLLKQAVQPGDQTPTHDRRPAEVGAAH